MSEDYEHRLTTLEEANKTIFIRIDEIKSKQEDLDELVSSVKLLAVREENVENDVKEIKADVKALTNKPAERWNDLIKTILGIVVAAVAGFILAKIGL